MERRGARSSFHTSYSILYTHYSLFFKCLINALRNIKRRRVRAYKRI